MLPKVPEILLCIINTKLRDQYSSLEELCDDLDENILEISSCLENAGYYYNEDCNQFKQK